MPELTCPNCGAKIAMSKKAEANHQGAYTPKSSDYWVVVVGEALKHTAAAILFRTKDWEGDATEVWIPKSQIRELEEVLTTKMGTGILTRGEVDIEIPRWLAIEKELIEED